MKAIPLVSGSRSLKQLCYDAQVLLRGVVPFLRDRYVSDSDVLVCEVLTVSPRLCTGVAESVRIPTPRLKQPQARHVFFEEKAATRTNQPNTAHEPALTRLTGRETPSRTGPGCDHVKPSHWIPSANQRTTSFLATKLCTAISEPQRHSWFGQEVDGAQPNVHVSLVYCLPLCFSYVVWPLALVALVGDVLCRSLRSPSVRKTQSRLWTLAKRTHLTLRGTGMCSFVVVASNTPRLEMPPRVHQRQLPGNLQQIVQSLSCAQRSWTLSNERSDPLGTSSLEEQHVRRHHP